MPHSQLRELAFQMQSDQLRQYGQDVLVRNPNRVAAAEVLDLMAYLVACDFVGAEAKLSTIKYKFKGTSDEIYVEEAATLAQAHVDFAFGRFNSMEEAANSFLNHHLHIPNLEEGEFLDILRLLAQKHLIMDENTKLFQVYLEAAKYESKNNDLNLYYLINSIQALKLLAEGEYFQAIEVANRNIEIAKQNNYRGLMVPIDSMYVVANCLFSTGKIDESLKLQKEIAEIAEEHNLWPWYFIADGFISRNHAHKGRMSEALALVRSQRNRLTNFDFRHELNFIPDINEIYVRFLISDFERLEVLLERVPNLIIVEQIRAFLHEIQGKDMLKYIEELPDQTPREKIYKLVALSDYYKDKESVAVDYMEQALKLVEKSGATEIILRQYGLAEIILKAVAKKPTVFLENLASQLADRIKQKIEQNGSNLPIPLTTRELEVVRHLSTGKPISAIAETLHVSMNTMKTHLRNIYRKLDVDGRTTAVDKAKELFLI